MCKMSWKSWTSHEKEWTSCEETMISKIVINKSYKFHGQVMSHEIVNKSWTIHEHVVNNSWTSHEQVMNNLWTLCQTALKDTWNILELTWNSHETSFSHLKHSLSSLKFPLNTLKAPLKLSWNTLLWNVLETPLKTPQNALQSS